MSGMRSLDQRMFSLLGEAATVDEIPTVRYQRGVPFEPGTTYVYFIRAGRYGPIKIGVAKDPYDRLRELQVGNPYYLQLLRAIPGNVEMEAMLHRYFRCIRLAGEWFEGSDLFAGLVTSPHLEELVHGGYLESGDSPVAATCSNCGIRLRASYGIPWTPGFEPMRTCAVCDEFEELRERGADPFEELA